ncbi:alanine-glyoxylate aminotransferase [Thermoclostridium stercorarium subsp. stercorarium DSM 8532]|nr:alanine-glyoxylate aminotransferase [Thermoclostridium stercorarium subsp. stercorarium DSM 8532]
MMKQYEGFTWEQLVERKKKVERKYEIYKNKNFNLDMSRGKPCVEQLNLSNEMYKLGASLDFISEDGVDCRNYGLVDGIVEMKRIFAQILGVSEEEIILGDSSSLSLMYGTIEKAFIHGLYNCEPWKNLKKIKFLCPSPGYDRHFAICELFGIEMITVPMKEDGPDMDMVEKLVAEDESIKGIWCTPIYSNPTGVTYSDEVVRRFATMKTKANDFKIFWDVAYIVHHLYEEQKLLNILDECKKAGNPDRVFIYISTSKITFPGAGVAAMACSVDNARHLRKLISIQTIGPNKINHLLHARFFRNADGVKAHMRKHAEILRPKFELVNSIFEKNLGGLNIAQWTKPKGGYFISLDVPEGCAMEIVTKAQEAGVKLTPAGATFPYGKDPYDKNIRIAPTYPPVEELEQAMEILCTCIELVVLDKILSDGKDSISISSQSPVFAATSH